MESRRYLIRRVRNPTADRVGADDCIVIVDTSAIDTDFRDNGASLILHQVHEVARGFTLFVGLEHRV